MNNHTYVVCAYKESEFLETCIRSLLAQSVPSDILIATSTDNDFIRALAEKYALPLYTHQDGGIGKDWNFGMSQAKTQYVTIAHQDDVYLSHYTEELLAAFEKNPRAAIAFSDYHEIRGGEVAADQKNLKIKKLLLMPLRVSGKSRLMRKASLAFGNSICCPAVSYNMALLGDFRFDETLGSNLDWTAWADLSDAGHSFAYVPQPLMLHRIHGGSETTNAIGDSRRTQEDLAMFERFWPKRIAAVIEKFYKSGEDSNHV